MKKVIYILLVTTLLVIGCFVLFNYLNRTIPLTQEVKSQRIIYADSLSNKNTGQINFQEYNFLIEKAIKIKGKIKHIKKRNDNYNITLSSTDKTVTILCKMQKDQAEKIKTLQKGESIMIKGIYKGSLMDMILLNCIIL